MSTDRTKKEREQEKFTIMIKSWIDQFAHTLQSTDTKNYIQVLVLEPFMKYILDRTFPYVIIACCIFGGIFLFVVLTFVLLLMRPASHASSMLSSSVPTCPFCKG
jgi:accessory gene regulator protein AgrB